MIATCVAEQGAPARALGGFVAQLGLREGEVRDATRWG
jgi:hypothetical protein